MESERLLRLVNSQKTLDKSVIGNVKEFLSPVLLHSQGSLDFSKYELFALKLLKAVIERSSSNKQACTPPLRSTLLHIGQLCVECLRVSYGSSGKAPSMSFERLLLHFVKTCFTSGHLEEGEGASRVLLGQLCGSSESQAGGILKPLYEILWKAAVQIESECPPKSTEALSEKCLVVRGLALKALMHVPAGFNVEFIAERALRSCFRFQKVHSDPFKPLHAFHSSLLEHSGFDYSLAASRSPLCVEYRSHVAHIEMEAGAVSTAKKMLQGIRTFVQQLCNKVDHCVWMELSVELSELFLHLHNCRAKLPQKSVSLLSKLAGIMSSIEVVSAEPVSSMLSRALQRIESIVNTLSDGCDSQDFIPPAAFASLTAMLTTYVRWKEAYVDQLCQSSKNLNGCESMELRLRSCQSVALTFLGNVATDLLLVGLRKTKQQRVKRQPITTLTPSPARKELVETSLTTLTLHRQLLANCTSKEERRRFASTAYNLGFALHSNGYFTDAVVALELCTDQLLVWLTDCRGTEESALLTSNEYQLLPRFALLIDSQSKAKCFPAAMATLKRLIASLPATQLSDEECLDTIGSVWCSLKQEAGQGGGEEALGGATLLDLLPHCGSASGGVKESCLENDLKLYKSSGGPRADQVAVCRSLRELYQDRPLELARVTTELAVLLRPPDPHTDSPLSLLDEAVAMVEPITAPPHPPHTLTLSHQQLATTHLWRAVCAGEQLISACSDSSDSGEPPADPAPYKITTSDAAQTVRRQASQAPPPKEPRPHLEEYQLHTAAEERALLSEEVSQCLHTSLHHWQLAAGCYCPPLEAALSSSSGGAGLDRLGEVCHSLLLTAEVCCAHKLHMLAMKALEVLLQLYQQTPRAAEHPQLRACYQHALAKHCHLHPCLSWGAGQGDNCFMEPLSRVAADSLDDSANKNLQLSSLQCKVSLAEYHLAQGELDLCRSALLDVLNSPLALRNNPQALFLKARAHTLAAELSQQRSFPLQPGLELFKQLLLDPPSAPGEEEEEEEDMKAFRTTPLEFVVAGLKLYRGILDHYSSKEGHADAGQLSQLEAWEALNGLLEALRCVAVLHLRSGCLMDCFYYAREGAELARRTLLPQWYVEFVLLLSEVASSRGRQEQARAVLQQAGRVLPSHDSLTTTLYHGFLERANKPCPETTPTTTSAPPPLFVFSPAQCARCLQLSQAVAKAKELLQVQRAAEALKLLRTTLAEFGDMVVPGVSSHIGVDLSIELAQLHYTIGLCIVHQMHSTSPRLTDKLLWANHDSEMLSKQRTIVLKSMSDPESISAKEFPTSKKLRALFHSLTEAVDHFLTCYQLCFPGMPSNILHNVCGWLAVCLGCFEPRLASHFASLSVQVSLRHQAAYTWGRKLRANSRCSRVQEAVATLTPSHPPIDAGPAPLLKARNTLLPPSAVPLTPSHTHHLHRSLPPDWTLCTVLLAPKTTAKQAKDHLIIMRYDSKEGEAVAKVALPDLGILDRLAAHLASIREGLELKERKAWWEVRLRADHALKRLLSDAESQWMGDFSSLFTPREPGAPLVLILGSPLHNFPWENLPSLYDVCVMRMPSLAFTVAHMRLLEHPGSLHCDPRNAYYLVDPGNSLDRTRERFGPWFSNERGWQGLAGSSPTQEELLTALQQCSLYIYCGHGSGRTYLGPEGIQAASCNCTAVLMGCSSMKLVAREGRVDPAGMALNCLMAGCPAVVGNLWDVTDGEIDRLCAAFLKSVLSEDPNLMLPQHLIGARGACRCARLTGASPVVYGAPVYMHGVK